MSKRAGERTIKRNLRALKDRYLEECESEGGERPEFVRRAVSEMSQVLGPLTPEAVATELIADAATSVWEDKPPHGDDKQKVLPGILDPEIRFRDPSTESGYRTVLDRYATFQHLRRSIKLLEEKREEIEAKESRLGQVYQIGLRLAGGNLEARVAVYAAQILEELG